MSAEVVCAGLTKIESIEVSSGLWDEHTTFIREQRESELKSKQIKIGGRSMRFESRTYGSEPEGGWSLIISLHGGGAVPQAVNNRQWINQIKLGDDYSPENAIYVAPRATSDTWDMWHQEHVDRFVARLIENFVVLEGVNPNKVYLIGYSAGGDGVYQLASRLADRLAGAAMMAGHPNDASPLGLRNLAFAIHVGKDDGTYNRSSLAAEWGKQFEDLRENDAGGYRHQVRIHEGRGHWMELADKEAIPWLLQFSRDPLPKRVVWHQDDVVTESSYWLAVPSGSAKKGQLVIASIEGQTIHLEKSEGVEVLVIRLNDEILDLDQNIRVQAADGSTLFSGSVDRSKDLARRTLKAKGDKALTFFGEIKVDLTDGMD